MKKVYVTPGELKALDDSIETHKHKQLDLDSGENSYVWCGGEDCACCIHAGISFIKGANCYKCAIGKAGYEGCIGIGWRIRMKKDDHQHLLDKLIEIREHCIIKKTKNVKVV